MMPWYIVFVISLGALALFCFCLMLFLIKPNPPREEAQWMRGKRFAHRGLFNNQDVPENSIPAFCLAREKQYGVELDVQLTKDEQVVVFHDGDLKRMCGVDEKVRDLTLAQLRVLRLGGTRERIPLFSEVLQVLGETPVICEIKPDAGEKLPLLCEKTQAIFQNYRGKICIESFSPFAVRWFRRKRPDIIRGQLSAGFRGKNSNLNRAAAFLMRNLFVNAFGRPDFIAFEQSASTFGLRLCRRVYRPLWVAWTARGAFEIRSAEKNSDAVIFELR